MIFNRKKWLQMIARAYKDNNRTFEFYFTFDNWENELEIENAYHIADPILFDLNLQLGKVFDMKQIFTSHIPRHWGDKRWQKKIDDRLMIEARAFRNSTVCWFNMGMG